MSDGSFLGGAARHLLLADAGAGAGALLVASSLAGKPVTGILSQTLGNAWGWVRGTMVGYDAESCRKSPVPCLRDEGRKLETTQQSTDVDKRRRGTPASPEG